MPYFAHVSLILAPDRSKLSKRHGATSVGQVEDSKKFYVSSYIADRIVMLTYSVAITYSSERWAISLKQW